MIIVVDTREKQPWSFSPRIQTIKHKLDSGDYSILGHESRIAIERKSKNDFVSSICKQRSRFQKELIRLQAFDFAAVVVECQLFDVLAGDYVSSMNPKSVLATVASITVDYGIPVFFAGHRAASAVLAEELLLKCEAKMKRK